MAGWLTEAGAALALASVEAPTSVHAVTCPVKLHRWSEDCRSLADSPRSGLDALRYVPLSADGSVWISFGAELRARVEGLDSVDYGIAQGPDYLTIANRGLVHADLRTAVGPRLFVQLSAAYQGGRRPAARSFDESDPDIAQAFVDLPLTFNGGSLSLRVGRQELSLDNRLVSLRDGVTLRRAFDGGRVDLTTRGLAITGLLVSPVLNAPGAFDDRRTLGETFRGISIKVPMANEKRALSFFAFERRRRLARFASAIGAERRQSFGFRYASESDRSDLEIEAVAQRGEVDRQNVAASGMAVDYGWRPSPGSATRIGAAFSAASGDQDPQDSRLNTFDPLYPNLGAFGDAPIYYYANQINAQVNAERAFSKVTVRGSASLNGRYDTSDAIYVSPGRVLATPPSNNRFSAVVLEASARWAVRPGVEVYASILRAEALKAVRAVGGDDVAFGLLQVTAAF